MSDYDMSVGGPDIGSPYQQDGDGSWYIKSTGDLIWVSKSQNNEAKLACSLGIMKPASLDEVTQHQAADRLNQEHDGISSYAAAISSKILDGVTAGLSKETIERPISSAIGSTGAAALAGPFGATSPMLIGAIGKQLEGLTGEEKQTETSKYVEESQKQHPFASFLSELGGGLGVGVAAGAAGVGKVAAGEAASGLLSRVGEGALQGAGFSMADPAYRLGRDPSADTLENLAESGAAGAIAGASLNGLLYGIGKAAKNLWNFTGLKDALKSANMTREEYATLAKALDNPDIIELSHGKDVTKFIENFPRKDIVATKWFFDIGEMLHDISDFHEMNINPDAELALDNVSSRATTLRNELESIILGKVELKEGQFASLPEKINALRKDVGNVLGSFVSYDAPSEQERVMAKAANVNEGHVGEDMPYNATPEEAQTAYKNVLNEAISAAKSIAVKRLAKPVVGGVIGSILGGPVGGLVGAGVGEVASNSAAKSALHDMLGNVCSRAAVEAALRQSVAGKYVGMLPPMTITAASNVARDFVDQNTKSPAEQIASDVLSGKNHADADPDKIDIEELQRICSDPSGFVKRINDQLGPQNDVFKAAIIAQCTKGISHLQEAIPQKDSGIPLLDVSVSRTAKTRLANTHLAVTQPNKSMVRAFQNQASNEEVETLRDMNPGLIRDVSSLLLQKSKGQLTQAQKTGMSRMVGSDVDGSMGGLTRNQAAFIPMQTSGQTATKRDGSKKLGPLTLGQRTSRGGSQGGSDSGRWK